MTKFHDNSLGIIGLGEYFRKIYPGIVRHFDIKFLLDIKDFWEIGLNKSYERVYANSLKNAAFDSCNALMILSPPSTHYTYLKFFERYNDKAVFVEKPLVCNQKEFADINLQSFAKLYCSDYYLDIRAIPLLCWFDKKNEYALENGQHLSNKGKFNLSPSDLGELLRIEGTLFEEERSDKIITRFWLNEKPGGGVILDLMYHYFMISFGLQFSITEINLKFPTTETAERYAKVDGVFDHTIPFSFEVCNNSHKTQKVFTLIYTNGKATMKFNTKNELLIETGNGITEGCYLTTHYYDLVSSLFYRFCQNDKKVHNLISSEKTILAISTQIPK